MNHNHLIPTVTLFALTAAAFTNAQYALGTWLALGTIATAAYGLAFSWFEDRPMTVEALGALDASLASALREMNGTLADLSKRVEHQQTYLSATQTANRGGSGALRSPLRPPGVR